MTDRKPPGLAWDSFVEQQILDAQQAGKFDDLPGFGRPIAGLEEPPDENWWLKRKAREENLSLLPPALQIRVDVDQTLTRALELASEADVRRAIAALNERIRQANFAIAWGPSSTTMPLDIDRVVRQWRARLRGP